MTMGRELCVNRKGEYFTPATQQDKGEAPHRHWLGKLIVCTLDQIHYAPNDISHLMSWSLSGVASPKGQWFSDFLRARELLSNKFVSQAILAPKKVIYQTGRVIAIKVHEHQRHVKLGQLGQLDKSPTVHHCLIQGQ